jgi:hypothetical protein
MNLVQPILHKSVGHNRGDVKERENAGGEYVRWAHGAIDDATTVRLTPSAPSQP